MSYVILQIKDTHSINCTPVTAAVTAVTVTAAIPPLDFLPGPFRSPQTSQIQISQIFRGGINWSVCRSNSQGTLYSKLEKILFERFEEKEIDHATIPEEQQQQ